MNNLSASRRIFSSYSHFNAMRMFASTTKALPLFTSKVLMVEPTHFFLNEETFADNKFMNKVQEDQATSSKKAKEEFYNLVESLKSN